MNIKKSLPERQQIHIYVRFQSPKAQHDIPTVPTDFPGTYQLSQGACLLLFNVDHMLMFFLSTFQCTFQSILVNLAILIILIVDPIRTPISWHPARTAATLEGR